MSSEPARQRLDHLIPESAAGRDDVFFFGTLVHPEVLTAVLDRDLRAHETSPATLHAYRCERAALASYPVLVPDPAASVAGRLLHRPSRRDIRRVNHFEDEEYTATRVIVRSVLGRRPAWAFMALGGVAMMRPSGEPWQLDRWAEAHLHSYRLAIRQWMSNAPD